MTLAFFEVADWEREILQKNFPQATLTEEKLSEENIDKYKDFEMVSSFIYSKFTKEIIDKFPHLKFIATRSTGFDHIYLAYAKSKGILVANVPEYGSRTVAEHTFALILTLTRKIYQSINQAKTFDFDHKNIRGTDLFGKTLGIVGLGKIGLEVLKIAKAFGMNVIVYTRTKDEVQASELGFTYVTVPELFQKADIVTLHLPYSKETYHLINKENILQFKKGSYLINTARGSLVETEAVILGLSRDILAGVALDVLEEEESLSEEVEILTTHYRKNVDLKTLVLDHILINHPKVIITPHNAFNSKEALERILNTTIENIRKFEQGSPINLVIK